ncbi:Molybdate transporter 1 [Dichanthelium oligosanthes]|uniref:Molybdate transporter 1 n=1 Tax=Dichanthelium oligosanthes TaxID=888268 RepID=A0A1E5VR45_9POAL|nr:Molybdate transporter 1 [Dichanthelium oligosanthes]
MATTVNPDPEAAVAGKEPRGPRSLLARARDNLAFRSVWPELNGAMGDLGTYIPIVLSLALARNLDLGTTLIFTGIYNAVTGLIYGVPMPVQPMKAIAATALSDASFGIPEIMAAGILTAAFVLFLGVTRLMQLVYWIVPLPVVRGIQLAQGLNFAMAAVKYIRYEQDLGKGKSMNRRPWTGLDGLILAIAAIGFILLVNGAGSESSSRRSSTVQDQGHAQEGDTHPESQEEEGRQEEERGGRWRSVIRRAAPAIPSAVIVFVLGVAFAVARHPAAVRELRAGPSRMRVVRISREAWKQGFLKGAVPQIPLSVLNSVVAVCKLTRDLFPEKEASATSVSVTMGAMNLVGCWFGAMPCCHGAGGLAGQYKFGGRSGGCVAALGALKLALGLVLGGSMLRVLVEFPVGLLGVLLLFAGVELAIAARDMSSKAEALVMLLCTAVSLYSSSVPASQMSVTCAQPSSTALAILYIADSEQSSALFIIPVPWLNEQGFFRLDIAASSLSHELGRTASI